MVISTSVVSDWLRTADGHLPVGPSTLNARPETLKKNNLSPDLTIIKTRHGTLCDSDFCSSDDILLVVKDAGMIIDCI